jgi:hypothetical protein
MKTPKPMTIFWLLKTTPLWLQLPVLGEGGRFAFGETVLKPLLAKHPGATLRFFDVEGFTAEATDIMMWTVTKLSDYNAIVESLRETLFWDAYFHVKQILPALEDQYADHYEHERLQGSGASTP